MDPLTMASIGSMGLGALGSLFGGGGKSVSAPKLDWSAFNKSLKGLDKYSNQPLGQSQVGLAQEQAIRGLQGQQRDSLNKQMASSGATNLSNSMMYGADRGALERMSNNQALANTDQIANQQSKFAQMLQQQQAGDIATQDERKYDIDTRLRPNLLLQQQQANNANAMGLAQMQAQQNAASGARKQGFFNTLSGLGMMGLMGGKKAGG